MSVLYIRNKETGQFEPVKTIKGNKGDTGAVEGIEYWESAPKKCGTASPGTSDLMARGDHVHPMPTAQEVGALAKDATATNSAMLGGKMPAYYIQPHNLLDNSDFTNPVNQRGVSDAIDTTGYFIDRWNLVSGNVTISNEGLALDGTISQILEKAPIGTVTASASAGEAAFDAGTNTFSLTGSGVLVTWAALYEGEYTADTLPPYTPKGYAAELAECRRYFIAIKEDNVTAFPGFVISTDTVRIMLPTPSPMRVVPSFNINDISTITIYTVDGTKKPSSVSIRGSDNYAVYFNVKATIGAGCPITARFNANFSLSADL